MATNQHRLGKSKKIVRSPDGRFHCIANNCDFADRRTYIIKAHTSAHKGHCFEKNSEYPESDDDPLPPPQPYPLNPDTMKLVLAKLQLVPNTNVYKWSSGGQHCTHDSRDPLSEISCVDSSCAVLSYLQGMYYSPALKAIVASKNGMAEILTAKDLIKHIGHKTFPKHIRDQATHAGLKKLVNHVAKAFNMDVKESSQDSDFLKRVSSIIVPRPPPYFAEPTLGVKCPKCPLWFSRKSGLTRHWNGSRSCKLEIDEREEVLQNYQSFERYSQSYGPLNTGDRSGLKISLPDGWTPHGKKKTQITPPSLAPSGPYRPPSYFEEIGWWKYVSGIKGGGLEFLSQYTATPSRALIAAAEKAADKSPILEATARLERGLYQFSMKVAPLYLSDAQRLIEEYHPGLRDIILVE